MPEPEKLIDVTTDFFTSAANLTPKTYFMSPSLSFSEALRVPEYGNPALDAISCLKDEDTRLSLTQLISALTPEEAVYGVLCDFFCLTESMVPVSLSYHGIVAQAIDLLRSYLKARASSETVQKAAQETESTLLAYVRSSIPGITNTQLYILFSVYAILLSAVLLGSIHRNAFSAAKCKHNDDYNLDLLHYAMYLSLSEIESIFYDGYSAVFPYGVFIKVLNLEEKSRKDVPAYYQTSLFVLIQIVTAGVANGVTPKRSSQLLEDIMHLTQALDLSFSWLHELNYSKYLSNYYHNNMYHSKVYAVYTIARLDSRTLPEKEKPLSTQFSPEGIYRYMDSSRKFFFAMLTELGNGVDFFKDAYLSVYQLCIQKRPFTIVEKLSTFYSVNRSIVTLQAIEYVRRIDSLLCKSLSRSINDVVNMASDTLSRLAMATSLGNVLNLDRIYRKFCYSHFMVWFTELDTIKSAFSVNDKTRKAYERLRCLLGCWALEFGLLPYYRLFEPAGYLYKTEVPFYYYVMYFIIARIIWFYTTLLGISVEQCTEKIGRFEDPDYLVEKDDEARFSPSSLELACIRYCRLAVYYQNKLLSTYPIHIDYYELDGASAVPLDDIYQIQNRYKVLTIFSRDAHWIFETSDQGAQFIPGIIKDMISFCGVARKADGSEDTLVLPGINCRLALPIPSGDALVRAIRDHKSKLASMHMPKTQYYRHVLEDDIMSLVG
ncbi:hypothetical protein GL50803_007270 [Giardia duodenalis]|uniref:Uncharacterized protein n=1 Tax=Giardia intestinalis (strain ATCC 50803 / WB clone C6) TaxID=184922 RepID=A8B3N2_GIAIC|nr:hypothetical protein GL50803_007270 [Giardia intestinalis]KAE8303198.1 hypothetical protein GL50803_007270 [Giardia intestinalis]|eukprot:XP_001710266.1 Hypothetical protein GL50803_7270 [Giardia lamblia ATCC 50803]